MGACTGNVLLGVLRTSEIHIHVCYLYLKPNFFFKYVFRTPPSNKKEQNSLFSFNKKLLFYKRTYLDNRNIIL